MSSYSSNIGTTQDYLEYLYGLGFAKSNYLEEPQVVQICDTIGVFKLKGYAKEIKSLNDKRVDDLLFIYFFDRLFAKEIFDITIRIEAKIKSILINECYKLTANHYFYLPNNNHKWNNYRIDEATLKNWEKSNLSPTNQTEHYNHYILFYLQNYTFEANKKRYLGNTPLLSTLNEDKYNYPPFKYLIESATLGSVISFIRSLKIGNSDIEAEVSRHFNISNAQTFKHYLERLSEIRNRAAHGGRLFNRTFRSASGIGKFQTFRASISTHKALDVALFLHFMLNQLQEYRSFEDFKHKQIAKLFQKLKKDSLSSMESFDLIKKYTKHDTNRIKRKIIERMSI